MFGIGFPELALILIIALLLFGPDKLPEVAKFLGKTVRQVRDTVEEAKHTIEEEVNKSELAQKLKDIDREVKAIPDLGAELKEIGRDIRDVPEQKGTDEKAGKDEEESR